MRSFLKNKVYLSLISRFGGNHIFKSLRTDKMIGYVTQMNSGIIGTNHTLNTCIQGNKYSTLEMDAILNEWYTEFEQFITN